jgi:hypothetical protein
MAEPLPAFFLKKTSLALKMGLSNSNGSYLAALVYGLHADTTITQLCIQNCAEVINLNRLNHDVLCR